MSKHKKTSIRCDQFRQGTCRTFSERGQVVYCPRARAETCGPGECCHHPLVVVRERLSTMTAAGVKLARYGKRLRDPEFVERLWSAFLKARR